MTYFKTLLKFCTNNARLTYNNNINSSSSSSNDNNKHIMKL